MKKGLFFLIQKNPYVNFTKILQKNDSIDIDISKFNLLPNRINKDVLNILYKISRFEKFNFNMDRKDHYKKDLYINKDVDQNKKMDKLNKDSITITYSDLKKKMSINHNNTEDYKLIFDYYEIIHIDKYLSSLCTQELYNEILYMIDNLDLRESVLWQFIRINYNDSINNIEKDTFKKKIKTYKTWNIK